MPPTSAVPITVSSDAKEFIAEAALGEPFQQMLERTLQGVPGLRTVNVTLMIFYDEDNRPCVEIEAMSNLPFSEAHTLQGELNRWRHDTFPMQVCEHFYLTVSPRADDAR